MSRLLLQCTLLSKAFGNQIIFDAISLSINCGERYALIGENGAGKTTLLRILAGMETADAGSVQRAKALSIGYLPQEVAGFDPAQPARDYLHDTLLNALERQMTQLESQLAEPEHLARWGELQHEYERRGGYQRIPVEEVLHQLKIGLELHQPMGSLSGGQRARIALAKALLENFDVLLLDEPTNHLDQEMTAWLQRLLLERKTAALIVSHDRTFLNAACSRLIELRQGQLTAYGGSYDFYLQEQENRIQRQLKAHERQQEEKQLLQDKISSLNYARRAPRAASDNNKLGYNHRGAGHQKSLQRNLETYKAKLHKIEQDPVPHPQPKHINGLAFSPCPLPSAAALEFADVSKAFAGKQVVSGFSACVRGGQRVVMCGPNGSGKTTLLSMAAGTVPPDQGRIIRPPAVKMAYLDQEVTLLPLAQTPLAYFSREFGLSELALCQELYKAGLPGAELIGRPFGQLSVGQRKRLMLLSLVLSKPNLLLLDEPTNHLDFATLEQLEKALLSFEGAILAVSHDQTFIDKIATDVWRIDPM